MSNLYDKCYICKKVKKDDPNVVYYGIPGDSSRYISLFIIGLFV